MMSDVLCGDSGWDGEPEGQHDSNTAAGSRRTAVFGFFVQRTRQAMLSPSKTIVVGIFLSFACSGCSSGSYLRSRGYDAADVFTSTVGINYGAKARVGPFRVGLFGGVDVAGLRAGEFGSPFLSSGYERNIDLETTVTSAELFVPESYKIAKLRGKLFSSEGFACFAVPDAQDGVSSRQNAAYFTQFEIAAGLFAGARLGFNPGEFLDFLLGWTTFDIYEDDLAVPKENITSEDVHL